MGRLDINDAVAEAVCGAGAAVVDFVGIEHDDLAAGAGPRRAPVVEDLDAAVRDADGVRVMAVLLVDLVGERGAEQLDTFDRRRAGQPAARALARSFKTLAARPGFLGAPPLEGTVPPPRRPVGFFS